MLHQRALAPEDAELHRGLIVIEHGDRLDPADRDHAGGLDDGEVVPMIPP